MNERGRNPEPAESDEPQRVGRPYSRQAAMPDHARPCQTRCHAVLWTGTALASSAAVRSRPYPVPKNGHQIPSEHAGRQNVSMKSAARARADASWNAHAEVPERHRGSALEMRREFRAAFLHRSGHGFRDKVGLGQWGVSDPRRPGAAGSLNERGRSRPIHYSPPFSEWQDTGGTNRRPITLQGPPTSRAAGSCRQV